MLDTAAKLIALLDHRERVRLALLFLAMLMMAFLQMASIAAVMPFLSVAADPSLARSNPWLLWAYDMLGFTSVNRFLVGLGAAALLALVVSNAWMAATQWGQFRFVRARTHGLSMKLMTHYLAQPYVYFLGRNSADLGKNVLAEVEQVTSRVLLPGLQLLSRAVVVLAILGLLIAFDPLLALIVTAVLGGAYGLIYLGVRRALSGLGATRVSANTARYKAAGEAFGAVKDVKLMGKERAFLDRFRGPSQEVNRVLAGGQIISELPRYALETIAFGGVLVIAVTLLMRGEALQQVIPVLGLYVFAGYRLMPSLQQIFHGVTTVRFGAPALDHLYHDLTCHCAAPAAAGNGRRPQPLMLHEDLELANITFTYPGAEKPALKDISLTIKANSTVGIMGPTGAGKTTLVDVILGLLRPERGEIRIDGTALSDHTLAAWQAGLGYAAQHIWLSDDTVAANIAFGVAPQHIDMAAVERAARLAQIHDFISAELPARYLTVVGERGIRLSGGQRQRIGIARALYRDPGVLVFDEATSALDNDTEAAVMAAVERLAGQKTLIIIAHRLTTLAGCDEVVSLDGDRLIAAGNYDDAVRSTGENASSLSVTPIQDPRDAAEIAEVLKGRAWDPVVCRP